jgi:coenzyme PQQ precursor peptide PqqA
MQWTRPDFQEITLGMEVTAYVNTDDAVNTPLEHPSRTEEPASDPAGEKSA